MVMPDNDVIQELNPQEFTCVGKAGRKRSVFPAGLDITAGVVVAAYDGCGLRQDRGLKYFTRMNHRSRQTSHRYRMDSSNAVLLVKEEHHKVFAVGTFEVFV